MASTQLAVVHALLLLGMAATLAAATDDIVRCTFLDSDRPSGCKEVCAERGYNIGWCDYGVCACLTLPTKDVEVDDVDAEPRVPAGRWLRPYALRPAPTPYNILTGRADGKM